MSTPNMADIQDFLAQQRLALVGLSTHEGHFSRMVYEEMKLRGYDLVPVNPAAEEVAGVLAFSHVHLIKPYVDGVLVMTPAAASAAVVRDCITAGVTRVWLHRGAGAGAVSEEAVELCRHSGIRVVEGACPLMFLRDAAWFHRLHGLGKKLVGSYPR